VEEEKTGVGSGKNMAAMEKGGSRHRWGYSNENCIKGDKTDNLGFLV